MVSLLDSLASEGDARGHGCVHIVAKRTPTEGSILHLCGIGLSDTDASAALTDIPDQGLSFDIWAATGRPQNSCPAL